MDVMTYVAVGLAVPRLAIATSHDLTEWTRHGLLSYDVGADGVDFNVCSNKDAGVFPDIIFDPDGVPWPSSLTLLP